jgi:NTP pyrophosphatase (non-canonical NTP hydrolase)
MIDLTLLTQTSYEIAKSKGWWDKERSFAALTLLMQSEISEALEDYRAKKGLNEVWYESSDPLANRVLAEPSGPNDKFCGIPSELADVVIRCCDFAGHYGLELKTIAVKTSDNFEVALARASLEISKAFDVLDAYGLETDGHRSLVSIFLSGAIAHLDAMCVANNIDLGKAIEIKTAFNRTRPQRHGGKAI